MHTTQPPGVLLQLAHAHEASLRQSLPIRMPIRRPSARNRLGAVMVALGTRLESADRRHVTA